MKRLDIWIGNESVAKQQSRTSFWKEWSVVSWCRFCVLPHIFVTTVVLLLAFAGEMITCSKQSKTVRRSLDQGFRYFSSCVCYWPDRNSDQPYKHNCPWLTIEVTKLLMFVNLEIWLIIYTEFNWTKLLRSDKLNLSSHYILSK